MPYYYLFLRGIIQGFLITCVNMACYQPSHNAIFHWNFQKYSVKIFIAIIDWVCGNPEIMHCGILINTPYFHLSTVYQQAHNLIFRKMTLHNVWVMRVMEHLLLCWMMKGNTVSSVIALVIRQTTSPVKQTSQTCSSHCIALFYFMNLF